MANRVFSSIKTWNVLLRINFSKLNCYSAAITGLQERQLYSKATLGIESFLKQRDFVEKQMSNISEKFKEKIEEYCKDINKNMIFSEDLKNMIYLANSNKDLEIIVTMMKKYNKQNKQIRFGNFVFGPVLMRLFHIQNVPELALECFKSEELDGIFDQVISYQILLDLLFENKKYQDMLDTVNIIKSRQIEGHKYPRNVVVLAMAACYKMNTKESLDYALKLWKEIIETGHSPMRRAVTFCAALAVNQNEPGIALEILVHCRNQNYTTVRNLKVAALSDIGRTDNIVPILKSVLSEDIPTDKKHTFNKEVIERLQTSLLKIENSEVVSELNNLIGALQQQGNINNTSLDEQLCQEIEKPPMMNSREGFQNRRTFDQKPEYINRRRPVSDNKRPGLYELV